MNSSSLSLPSFAKINWNLEILGKRPDGYHEVRTILQTISLHDQLHFEVIDSDIITLTCSEPNIPTDDRNLAVRAARILKDRYQVDRGVRIRVEKKIPAKAGLGGASSNAAVTLLALTQLWKVDVNASLLLEIAASLGADVPFFLMGGCAFATGIGTTLHSLPEQDLHHLLVVTPKAEVSTAAAYAAINSDDLTAINGTPILSSSHRDEFSRDSMLSALGDDLTNDFEPVIFDIEPEIRRTKDALLQAGARKALLAGSGSSVFGIFADRKAQQRAVDEIQLEADWRIFSCVTVSRAEYVSAMSARGVSLLRSFNSESDIGA